MRSYAIDPLLMIEELSTREQVIISLYFGFSDDGDHSLEMIGEIIGLNRHYVSRLKNGALEKLKRLITDREGTLHIVCRSQRPMNSVVISVGDIVRLTDCAIGFKDLSKDFKTWVRTNMKKGTEYIVEEIYPDEETGLNSYKLEGVEMVLEKKFIKKKFNVPIKML